jgi:Tyrosine phosphatase family
MQRFRQVAEGIYRGSAPSVNDVKILKDKFNIKKIISLDELAGKHIDRVCSILGIKHIMLPIDIENLGTLVYFLSQNIKNLLENGKPTFIHCMEGKDRTGLAIAIYRCQVQGWSAEKAIKEANQLGFGVGVPIDIVDLYKRIIKKESKDKQDINNADIVSNVRETGPDFTLDNLEMQSWSPYWDYRIKRYPDNDVQINYDEQYKARNDEQPNDILDMEINESIMPQSGTYDQAGPGMNGLAPSSVGSGIMP